MTDIIWIADPVILAIHDEQLAEHGGLSGTRDQGLLESALARPKNMYAYGEEDVAVLAAAYCYGIARNHPFLDGNKRTAFVAAELFLMLNGYMLMADDADCILTMLKVADGSLAEADFITWINQNITSVPA